VIICLVTDRRRADPVLQARRAADAGVDLIQVRERDLEASALAAIVTAVMHGVRGTETRVVVNDRLDIALACGAAGVHLRSDSIPAPAARALAPAGFLVGRSVHGVDEAVRSATDVDYLIAGTVFATASKPDEGRLIGTDGLRAIVAAVTVPVLAIGGVTGDRAGTIAECGAAGVAAIGLFSDGGGAGFEAITAALRRGFDEAHTQVSSPLRVRAK
jgi:thiamine-phosphate pyrophosphorylase